MREAIDEIKMEAAKKPVLFLIEVAFLVALIGTGFLSNTYDPFAVWMFYAIVGINTTTMLLFGESEIDFSLPRTYRRDWLWQRVKRRVVAKNIFFPVYFLYGRCGFGRWPRSGTLQNSSIKVSNFITPSRRQWVAYSGACISGLNGTFVARFKKTVCRVGHR